MNGIDGTTTWEAKARVFQTATEVAAFMQGRQKARLDGWRVVPTKAEREKLRRHILRVKCPVCASTVLRSYRALQVCGSCGQSWQTIRPGQVRENTDRAA